MKPPPDSSLTQTQQQVLALLADGRSITDAAAAAGVHRNTVRNWCRALPAFAREAECAVRAQAVAWQDRIVHPAPRASEVLQHVLHDETASPALRLRSALAVLKTAAYPQPTLLPHISTKNRRKESSVKQLPGKTIRGCAQRNSENMHNRAQRPFPPARRKRTRRTRNTVKLRPAVYLREKYFRPLHSMQKESG